MSVVVLQTSFKRAAPTSLPDSPGNACPEAAEAIDWDNVKPDDKTLVFQVRSCRLPAAWPQTGLVAGIVLCSLLSPLVLLCPLPLVSHPSTPFTPLPLNSDSLSVAASTFPLTFTYFSCRWLDPRSRSLYRHHYRELVLAVVLLQNDGLVIRQVA